MEVAIKFLAGSVNGIHDIIVELNDILGWSFSDKDLHFWIFGILGFTIFLAVDWLFRLLSKWNISLISFIYTFTLMIVLALTLEIMQKVTKRGNMEFMDFIYGVAGFLVFWLVYSLLRLAVLGVFVFFRKKRKKKINS